MARLGHSRQNSRLATRLRGIISDGLWLLAEGFAYRHDQAEDLFRADPWAEYALLTAHQGKLAVEYRRVDFDGKRLIESYRSSGRPYSESAVAQYQGDWTT